VIRPSCSQILVALAGFYGFCGIVLAAMAGHSKSMPQLRMASDILLFHAPTLLAILAARASTLLHQKAALIAAALMALGTFLFCADLLHRAVTGLRLLPMLAPIGGATMMLGWLLTVIAAFGKTDKS
jgi:uncharacterized membrane protein YgdD (TMEM256/DUF423 family)